MTAQAFLTAAALLISTLGSTADAQITQILDSSGDGAGSVLNAPSGIRVDSFGNVFIAGIQSDNVFKITPTGAISVIANVQGPGALGIDAAGNVYVLDINSPDVSRITPSGAVTTILDETGDGTHSFDLGDALAVGSDGVAYASGQAQCDPDEAGPCPFGTNRFSSVFRISASSLPELILDESAGGLLTGPTDFEALTVDPFGNLYVVANGANSVIKITPSNDISIVASFAMFPEFHSPRNLTSDPSGNIWVGTDPRHMFRLLTNGTLEYIIDSVPSQYEGVEGMVASTASVYVAAFGSDNVVEVRLDGTIRELLDITGDGTHPYDRPEVDCIALDDAGNIYTTGAASDNAFKIQRAESFLLSKDEQKCVNLLNKGLRKVSKTQNKEAVRCIQDEARGTLTSMTVDECLTADRKMKVFSQMTKVAAGDTKKCTPVNPPFGATDAATINATALQGATGLITALFGADAEGVIVPKSGATLADAKCQESVTRALVRCHDAHLKEFVKCKKLGLKDGVISTPLGIASCAINDSKGKIAKACAPLSSKLRRAVDKCGGVDLAAAFPGSCAAADAASVAQCLGESASCQSCRSANLADDLGINCDIVDDSQLNSSCTPVCGDGFVETPETCDDGNATSGDGCSSSCEIEP